MTLPVVAAAGVTTKVILGGLTYNNGAFSSTPAIGIIAGGNSTMSFYRDTTGTAWAASGVKNVNTGSFFYPI